VYTKTGALRRTCHDIRRHRVSNCCLIFLRHWAPIVRGYYHDRSNNYVIITAWRVKLDLALTCHWHNSGQTSQPVMHGRIFATFQWLAVNWICWSISSKKLYASRTVSVVCSACVLDQKRLRKTWQWDISRFDNRRIRWKGMLTMNHKVTRWGNFVDKTLYGEHVL